MILLIIYILAFILQIVGLIKCIKNNLKWRILILFETLSIFAAMFLMYYYDNLPGHGFMPGLTYFAEVLGSFGAIILYITILVITLFIDLIIFLIKKKVKIISLK